MQQFSYDLRPAFRALRALLLGVAGLVAGAALLASTRPWSAAALLGTGLVAGGVFLGWAPWLERLYRRPGPTRTANVEGRRPAAGPRRLTLVLLAHHDSKSQSLTLPWRAGLTLAAIPS